jgi:hypothetical protein
LILGESDSLISLDWGKSTSVQFHINGFDVQFRTYPHVDHEISDRELVDLFHWMKNRLITATEELKQPQKDKQRKQSHLESKYDSMTAELKEMEGKLSEEMGEDDQEEGKKEAKSQEKTISSSSSGKKESKEEAKKPDRVNCFPFTVEYLDDKPMTIVKVRIHFEVPSE